MRVTVDLFYIPEYGHVIVKYCTSGLSLSGLQLRLHSSTGNFKSDIYIAGLKTECNRVATVFLANII